MRTAMVVDIGVIKSLYEQGKSQDDISKILGVSQWVISHRMMDNKISRRNKTYKLESCRRKYHQDDCAFDVLTPKVAWILGWMLSDGYVSKNCRKFVLGVALKDRDILVKFKEFFKFDGPIGDHKATLKVTGKTYYGCTIGINSVRLVKKMLKYGIHPSKSQCETFPDKILNAPEEIQRCFIRGVFEGDGTLGHNWAKGRPQLVFQIVGTFELLKSIQKILIDYLGLRETSLTKYKASRNHYALRYVGNLQARRIFDWIYLNAEFFLDRKHKLYKEEIS